METRQTYLQTRQTDENFYQRNRPHVDHTNRQTNTGISPYPQHLLLRQKKKQQNLCTTNVYKRHYYGF